jgi:hypothetical protein
LIFDHDTAAKNRDITGDLSPNAYAAPNAGGFADFLTRANDNIMAKLGTVVRRRSKCGIGEQGAEDDGGEQDSQRANLIFHGNSSPDGTNILNGIHKGLLHAHRQ